MTNFNTFADCNVNKYFKNETKPLQCDTDEQWKTFWQVWLVLIEAKWVSAVYARDWVEEIYIEWVGKLCGGAMMRKKRNWMKNCQRFFIPQLNSWLQMYMREMKMKCNDWKVSHFALRSVKYCSFIRFRARGRKFMQNLHLFALISCCCDLLMEINHFRE